MRNKIVKTLFTLMAFSFLTLSCSKDKVAKIDCTSPLDITIQFDILLDNLIDDPSKKTCKAVIDYFQAVINKCGDTLPDEDIKAFNEAVKDIDCSIFD
jgi:hypothetical protein